MMMSSSDRCADAANGNENEDILQEARGIPRPAPALGGWQPVRLPVGSHISWITVPDYSDASPNTPNLAGADRRRDRS